MLMGTAAMADLVPVFEGGVDFAEPGQSPAQELSWLQDYTGNAALVFLAKFDPSGNVNGAVSLVDYFTITPVTLDDDEILTAEVSWDLTGSGYELRYVLLKDGSNPTGGGILYRLYEATANQYILSPLGDSDPEIVSFTSGRAISHISFFGVPTSVPEPTTLLLLGAGLLGVGILSRKLK